MSDPMNLRGTCEDPRLVDAGYLVCGSGGDTSWHWQEPSGRWHDWHNDTPGRPYRTEYAAVNAALKHMGKQMDHKAPKPATPPPFAPYPTRENEMDVREIIARAACKAEGLEPAPTEPDQPAWIDFAYVADAALAAIEEAGYVVVPKEPTMLMQNAGWRKVRDQGIEPDDIEVAPIYQAMIDCA